jgi:hypothetical protein
MSFYIRLIKYQNTSVRDKCWYVFYCALSTLHVSRPDQWPSSSELQHKIYLNAVTNISTDPLSQIYKRVKALVTVSLI